MPVPDFQTLMLPLLKLTSDGQDHLLAQVVERLADEFQLTADERAEPLPSGKQPRFYNRVGWATTYLQKSGLLQAIKRGTFRITDRGRDVLGSKPPRIDLRFLEGRFKEELSAFRNKDRAPSVDASAPTFDEDEDEWRLRPDVLERVRKETEALVPDANARKQALALLAFAIECADDGRSDAWYLRQTPHRLRLVTGGVLACEVTRAKLRVSVLGPISEDARTAVGAQAEDDDAFTSLRSAVLLTLPTDRATAALEHLKDSLSGFIDLAMGRVRHAHNLIGYHVPEAIAYVGEAVGRELPQPEPGDGIAERQDDDGEETDEDDAGISREPRMRGRPQIFERGERTIASLLSDISREVIALPDLQRPFVWEDTKVRNLFDSLFIGFPVGTLVLWHTSTGKEARAVGSEKQATRPPTLIIDGQQRLTSLVGVMEGRELVDGDGEQRTIKIAFRPRDGRFAVADAAIAKDPEYLPNITELWTGKRSNAQIRRDLLNALRDGGRAVDEAYEDAVERNLEVAEGHQQLPLSHHRDSRDWHRGGERGRHLGDLRSHQQRREAAGTGRLRPHAALGLPP